MYILTLHRIRHTRCLTRSTAESYFWSPVRVPVRLQVPNDTVTNRRHCSTWSPTAEQNIRVTGDAHFFSSQKQHIPLRARCVTCGAQVGLAACSFLLQPWTSLCLITSPWQRSDCACLNVRPHVSFTAQSESGAMFTNHVFTRESQPGGASDVLSV